MPIPDTDRKGHFQRHLSQIRRPPSRLSSVRSRRVSRFCVARELLRPVLWKRKSRCFLSRRRSVLSTSSRAATPALVFRRRISTRARQNIQLFGWNTDIAGQASTVRSTPSIEPAKSRGQLLESAKPTSETTALEFGTTEGAASSKTKRIVTRNTENPSLPQGTTGAPVYWTKERKPLREVLANVDSTGPTRPGEECYDCKPIGGPQVNKGKSKTEKPRHIPRKPVPSPPKSSTPRRSANRSRISPKIRQLQLSFEDPTVREAVNCLACKIKDSSSIVPSLDSIVNTLSSSTGSRTPGQKKAIKQFTKEIGLYLHAVRTLPKQSLYPSPSVTTVSAHTITELKPFRPEFQAAGLAVTSADQKMPLKKSSAAMSPPPTPPKDKKWDKVRTGKKNERQAIITRPQSVATTLTATTVLEFTPPYEKSHSSHNGQTPVYSSSESEATEIGFTPPHERYNLLPMRPAPVPTTSKKKSLPWLQRPEKPLEEPIFVSAPSKDLLERNRGRDWPNPKLASSPEVSPRVAKKRSQTKDTRGVTQSMPRERARRADKKTQTDPTITDIENETEEPNYAKTAIQTILLSGDPSRIQRETAASLKLDRSPLTTERSRTFPIQTSKYTDKAAVGRLEDKHPKRSRVVWKGIDSETQTDHSTLATNVLLQQPPERKKSLPEAEYLETSESGLALELGSTHDSGPSSPTRAPLLHHCTARSSLQCQQCAPESRISQQVSPFQTPLPSPKSRPLKPQPPVRPMAQLHQSLEPKAFSKIQACPTRNPPSPPKGCPPIESVPADQCLPSQITLSPPTIQRTAPHYRYYTCDPPKPLPPQQSVIIARPFPDPPSIATSLDACARDHEVTDKKVFKGLHVATAAACDEAVDKWIEEITGYGVRKLLADLSRFEGLGTNTLADVAKRASKQRRNQVRDWELVRESRVLTEKRQQEMLIVKNKGDDETMNHRDMVQTSRLRRQKPDEWEDIKDDYTS